MAVKAIRLVNCGQMITRLCPNGKGVGIIPAKLILANINVELALPISGTSRT